MNVSFRNQPIRSPTAPYHSTHKSLLLFVLVVLVCGCILHMTEINRLEAQRRPITVSSFYKSRLAGRAWREQLIPSFQLTLPDAGIATVLRVLSWLAPCPELGCLLLDWSRWRQPTKAGGVPLALFPIVRYLLRLDFAAARKLAFAQQLIAGIPDAGDLTCHPTPIPTQHTTRFFNMRFPLVLI